MHLGGQEEIIEGGKGRVSFGQDGSVSSFTFDDNAAALVFDPKNGSRNVTVRLDVGGPGDFTGLTQFRSPTTAAAVGQDGYTMGRLRQISIGEDGMVTGAFTNGTNKNLAQILVVDFTNPGGLQKVKDSVYTVSANSGDPIYGAPGAQSSSVIKPGALELSNVELAQEFTDMITTQRGYQANARVITVSDSLLEELVSLKR
jgi:flagellar hook protein FlgE